MAFSLVLITCSVAAVELNVGTPTQALHEEENREQEEEEVNVLLRFQRQRLSNETKPGEQT